MNSNPSERRGYRRERKAGHASPPPRMSPITYGLPVYGLLNEDEIEHLHQASMLILSEFGIAFYDEASRSILKEHGAKVQGDVVTFEPGLVHEYVGMAPSEFTQLSSNPQCNIVIRGYS